VRLLRAGDLDALLVFAGERLEVPSRHLRHHLLARWGREEQPEGAAVGAFDRQGRLHGFAFLDDYRHEGLRVEGLWVRSLVVAPWARSLGVAGRLVAQLLEAARAQGAPCVHADVDAHNAASLRVFERAGFRPAPPALTERLHAEGLAAGRRGRLVVLTWTAGEAPLRTPPG
jgi:mycothiol synthase